MLLSITVFANNTAEKQNKKKNIQKAASWQKKNTVLYDISTTFSITKCCLYCVYLSV